jgi:serine protease AprX
VIYGLQFAVDDMQAYDIRVVNMSLDATTPQSYTVDPLDAAVESAWFHGLVVVAAAGNRGTAPDAVQYAPANDPYVITVGAVDQDGTANTRDDTIASWSSQGTTQNGFQKPDVYAPGSHIVSLLAPKQHLRQRLRRLHRRRPVHHRTIAEVSALRAVLMPFPPLADQHLTPSNFLRGRGGAINYSRFTWSRFTWSTAQGPLSAGFARSSWSCTCGQTSTTGTVDPSRSAWSNASWSSSVYH